MWIHENPESVTFRYSQHLNCVVYKLLIVLARACMFDSFPCEDVAEGIISPSLQPREVFMCFLFVERSPNEGDIVRVEETFAYVRWDVGISGQFAVASDVDASESHFSVGRVSEPGAVDLEYSASHRVRQGVKERVSQNCLNGQESAVLLAV